MLAQFIPDSFFEALRPDALLWLVACGSIALLAVGADRAVTGASRLAAALGMSPVLIGATIVSLGTTSPETVVSVTAALRGKPGLALGNGVGSIICDTALIFGLSCVLARLPLDRFVLRRHGVLKLSAGALLLGLTGLLALVAGSISAVRLPQWAGLLFVALLVGYMFLSVRWGRRHPEIIPDEAKAERPREHVGRSIVLDLAMVIVGLAVVVFCSDVLISSVTELCERYRVPSDVLAVTLVAFGTSVPELATAIAAIAKGHPALLIGNVIGADILNVLWVIGASAAVTTAGLAVPPAFFYLHMPVMMLSLLMMFSYIFTRGATFRRWQGLPLLGLYAAYCVLLYFRVRGGLSV